MQPGFPRRERKGNKRKCFAASWGKYFELKNTPADGKRLTIRLKKLLASGYLPGQRPLKGAVEKQVEASQRSHYQPDK